MYMNPITDNKDKSKKVAKQETEKITILKKTRKKNRKNSYQYFFEIYFITFQE